MSCWDAELWLNSWQGNAIMDNVQNSECQALTRPQGFIFLHVHAFVRLILPLCILFQLINNKIWQHMKEMNGLLYVMMISMTCALSDSWHEVTSCIALLESLSFWIAFCQSCRPPTTESCSFAKWPHLWQSWRTISAIATFFIYGLMVSARGRRTFQLLTDTSSHLSSRFRAADLNPFLSDVRQRDMIYLSNVGFHRQTHKERRSIFQRAWLSWLKILGKDKRSLLYFYIRSFF